MADGKLLMSGAAPGLLVFTQLAALAYPSEEGSWGTWRDATAPSHGLGDCALKHRGGLSGIPRPKVWAAGKQAEQLPSLALLL